MLLHNDIPHHTYPQHHINHTTTPYTYETITIHPLHKVSMTPRYYSTICRSHHTSMINATSSQTLHISPLNHMSITPLHYDDAPHQISIIQYIYYTITHCVHQNDYIIIAYIYNSAHPLHHHTIYPSHHYIIHQRHHQTTYSLHDISIASHTNEQYCSLHHCIMY